jgi:hypothetical protein
MYVLVDKKQQLQGARSGIRLTSYRMSKITLPTSVGGVETASSRSMLPLCGGHCHKRPHLPQSSSPTLPLKAGVGRMDACRNASLEQRHWSVAAPPNMPNRGFRKTRSRGVHGVQFFPIPHRTTSRLFFRSLVPGIRFRWRPSPRTDFLTQTGNGIRTLIFPVPEVSGPGQLRMARDRLALQCRVLLQVPKKQVGLPPQKRSIFMTQGCSDSRIWQGMQQRPRQTAGNHPCLANHTSQGSSSFVVCISKIHIFPTVPSHVSNMPVFATYVLKQPQHIPPQLLSPVHLTS